MAYWRSEWGQAEKEAYKAGIRKGRKLEYEEQQLLNAEDEEIPFMCDPNQKKTKIDQVIEALTDITVQLHGVNAKLGAIQRRQEAAAERNAKPLTVTIPTDIQVDAAVKKAIRNLVK